MTGFLRESEQIQKGMGAPWQQINATAQHPGITGKLGAVKRPAWVHLGNKLMLQPNAREQPESVGGQEQRSSPGDAGWPRDHSPGLRSDSLQALGYIACYRAVCPWRFGSLAALGYMAC